ncbi:hypothetical protein RhiirA4_465370 [Rhizophagus irregularis]|uniref:Uncharacterized protein n=1 Tax=Rhizophagus irregularis TaxID=588596 RepID=A0A2I1GS11_9GLOM|nr:hypothetical protein RhiirA4_465370 [Rhizophagus irregularis]
MKHTMKKGDIEVNDNIGGRKCGICHKMGYYAPKCDVLIMFKYKNSIIKYYRKIT